MMAPTGDQIGMLDFEERTAAFESGLLARIGALIDANPWLENWRFLADPSLYTGSWEISLQWHLIHVLSEIRHDHPDLVGLSPICVRTVNSPTFASYCVPGPTVTFIVISVGLMKFLQVAVGTMIRLHDIGKSLRVAGPVRSNRVLGSDAAKAVRQGGKDVDHALDVLLGTAFRILDGEAPGLDAPLTPRLLTFVSSHPDLVLTYQMTEGFVVLHELGHLLRGHSHRDARKLETELDADEAALSLSVIVTSAYDNNSFLTGGPVAYLQLARLFEMVRRLKYDLDHPDPDRPIDVAPERELHTRLQAVVPVLERFGFDRRLTSQAEEFAREWSVLIAACQERLLVLVSKWPAGEAN